MPNPKILQVMKNQQFFFHEEEMRTSFWTIPSGLQTPNFWWIQKIFRSCSQYFSFGNDSLTECKENYLREIKCSKKKNNYVNKLIFSRWVFLLIIIFLIWPMTIINFYTIFLSFQDLYKNLGRHIRENVTWFLNKSRKLKIFW